MFKWILLFLFCGILTTKNTTIFAQSPNAATYFYFGYAEEKDANKRIVTQVGSYNFKSGTYNAKEYDACKKQWQARIEKEMPGFTGNFDLRMSSNRAALLQERNSYNDRAKAAGMVVEEIVFKVTATP